MCHSLLATQPPSIDPAWFYSTLAQCSAAIVGLIGAILGSKMLDHLSVVREMRKHVDDRLEQVLRQSNERIDDIKSYARYLRSELEKDHQVKAAGGTSREINSWRDWGSSSSGSAQAIDVNQSIVKKNKDLNDTEKILQNFKHLRGPVTENFINKQITLLTDVTKEIQVEPKRILENDIKLLQVFKDEFNCFQAKLLPKSFFMVFFILSVLSIGGIVWPLFALPGFKGFYSKDWMLIVFTIGLLCLMGYFIIQFNEFKNLGKVLWNKDEQTK